MAPILQSLGLQSPQASRLYIDLIRDVTSKWANWDPAVPIQPGDYGTVNRKTGELEVKGNIYNQDTNASIFHGVHASLRELVKRHPPEFAAREDDYCAVSFNARKNDLDLGSTATVPGIAEASLKGRWTFAARRGAFLLMARPQSSYIPHNAILEHLLHVEGLKDMCIVTQALSCSAFSLYLSNERDDDVSVALLGSAPVPYAPGTTAGGHGQARWWSSNSTGLFRKGLEPLGQDKYTPLYTIKKMRGKYRSRRGLPDPVFTGDDLWEDHEPPWTLLDEDGNEEPSDASGGEDDEDGDDDMVL